MSQFENTGARTTTTRVKLQPSTKHKQSIDVKRSYHHALWIPTASLRLTVRVQNLLLEIGCVHKHLQRGCNPECAFVDASMHCLNVLEEIDWGEKGWASCWGAWRGHQLFTVDASLQCQMMDPKLTDPKTQGMLRASCSTHSSDHQCAS